MNRLKLGVEAEWTQCSRPATLAPVSSNLWFALQRGGLQVPKLQEVATFGDGATSTCQAVHASS